MYENTERFVDLDFEQDVRRAAYHLWEDDGRPDGRETEYWFRALEELLSKRRSQDLVGENGASVLRSAERRSPKGDHNRRIALGMDVEAFALKAGIAPDALRDYEMTGPDHDFDVAVAQQVGEALERLETNPPTTQKVIS